MLTLSHYFSERVVRGLTEKVFEKWGMVQHDKHEHAATASSQTSRVWLQSSQPTACNSCCQIRQKYNHILSTFHYSVNLKYLSRSSITWTEHLNFCSDPCTQIFRTVTTGNTASNHCIWCISCHTTPAKVFDKWGGKNPRTKPRSIRTCILEKPA